MFDRLSPRVLLLIGLALPIAGCTNPLVDSITVAPAIAIDCGRTDCAIHGNWRGRSWKQPSIDHAGHHQLGHLDFQHARSRHHQLFGSCDRGFRRHNHHYGYHQWIYRSAFRHRIPHGQFFRRRNLAWSVGGRACHHSEYSIGRGRQRKPPNSSPLEPLPTGATVNLTNSATWSSSSAQIATIGANTGLATAVGQGTATITALYASGGSTLTATATFTVSAGTTEEYTAVTLIPSSQSVSASGQTGQFIALATSGTTGLEVDVTNSPQLKWALQHSVRLLRLLPGLLRATELPLA